MQISSDLQTVQSNEKNEQTLNKQRNKLDAVIWKKKNNLNETSQANVMHSAESHSHLAYVNQQYFSDYYSMTKSTV